MSTRSKAVKRLWRMFGGGRSLRSYAREAATDKVYTKEALLIRAWWEAKKR